MHIYISVHLNIYTFEYRHIKTLVKSVRNEHGKSLQGVFCGSCESCPLPHLETFGLVLDTKVMCDTVLRIMSHSTVIYFKSEVTHDLLCFLKASDCVCV